MREDKVVVVEDKFDETSALKSLARHELDREAALVILGNKELLQKDLLSDATREILRKIPR